MEILDVYHIIKVAVIGGVAYVVMLGLSGCGANLRTGEIGTTGYWEIRRLTQMDIYTPSEKKKLAAIINGGRK